MRFVPVDEKDRAAMLERIGVAGVEELFADVPPEVRVQGLLDLPLPMSEIELAAHLTALATKNTGCADLVCFAGGGCYDHYIPAIVDAVVSKPAFFTAYTPYQPEVSQGTLQAMYEYQSMVCMLTGMEVSNASLYDGATACAEAALMAARVTKRGTVIVSSAVHPEWRETLRTYTAGGAVEVVTCPAFDGVTDVETLGRLMHDDVAAVICASPSWYGALEDLPTLARIARGVGALLVVGTNPMLLGVLEAPGSVGADIVVAEGQPFGNPMSFGGPGLGMFACRQEHIRQMPGRVVGRTTDVDGRTGFVLTFSTREQHIRREKATSNICSNHALNALAAGVHMAALGPEGLAGVGAACVARAHYLADALVATGRFQRAHTRPFANEFTLRYDGDVAAMQARLLDRGIIAGIDLGRFSAGDRGVVLFAVTEKRTRHEIDRFAEEVHAL